MGMKIDWSDIPVISFVTYNIATKGASINLCLLYNLIGEDWKKGK